MCLDTLAKKSYKWYRSPSRGHLNWGVEECDSNVWSRSPRARTNLKSPIHKFLFIDSISTINVNHLYHVMKTCKPWRLNDTQAKWNRFRAPSLQYFDHCRYRLWYERSTNICISSSSFLIFSRCSTLASWLCGTYVQKIIMRAIFGHELIDIHCRYRLMFRH